GGMSTDPAGKNKKNHERGSGRGTLGLTKKEARPGNDSALSAPPCEPMTPRLRVTRSRGGRREPEPGSASAFPDPPRDPRPARLQRCAGGVARELVGRQAAGEVGGDLAGERARTLLIRRLAGERRAHAGGPVLEAFLELREVPGHVVGEAEVRDDQALGPPHGEPGEALPPRLEIEVRRRRERQDDARVVEAQPARV